MLSVLRRSPPANLHIIGSPASEMGGPDTMARRMKRVILLAASAIVVAALAASFRGHPVAQTRGAEPRARTAFRVTFGEKQKRETDYTGTVSLSEGRVTELIPWRFFGEDKLEGENGWNLVTRRANMENQPDQPR